MGKIMKITITQLQNVPNVGPTDIFVRVSIGSNPPWETPCLLRTAGTKSDFDVQTTITCDDAVTNQPLLVEVVDADSMKVLAHSSVAKWRSYLKDNKRTLVLDLKPSGTMQVELRIFDEPARVPDRLDILIASASDLPPTTQSPQVVLRVGDVTVSGGVPVSPRREVTGYFEWNEKHTVAYAGESELVMFVRNGDDALIGKTRFDLMEVVHATKTRNRVVGKLVLTDTEQKPVGSLKIGLALWDSKDVKKSTRGEFDKYADLRKRRAGDRDLYSYFHATPEMAEAPSLIECKRRLDDADNALALADQAVSAYEEPTNSKDDLKSHKTELKGSLHDTERHLDAAEALLQRLSLDCIRTNEQEARKARAKINAIARDARIGAKRHLPAEGDEDCSKLESLVKDAERQDEVFEEAISTVRSTHHAGDMHNAILRSLEALKRMNAILADAESVGGAVTDRMRDFKQAQRRAEHPLARHLNGPFEQVPEQSVGCFPCCF